MRIAFVYDAAYPWNVGGIEAIEEREARELAKRHDVHLFSLRWPRMRPTFKRYNVTYHTFHKENVAKFYRHGRRSIREAAAFAAGLVRLFRYRFDVVITNQFPVLHLAVVKLYCALTRARLVVDVAEIWSKEYWTAYLGPVAGALANAFASAAIRNADAYIVMSDEAKALLMRRGMPGSRISIFAPVIGSDVEGLAAAGGRAAAAGSAAIGRRRIMFSGRLIKEKRLDKWLEIVARARRSVPDLTGLIRGDGPEKRSIEREITRLGLRGVVRLMPFASEKKQIYRELRDSALLLQMSEREGLSVIVLESIALGTPVVLPRGSPIPRAIKSMCVIAGEGEIAAKVAEILKSGDKRRFISNRHMLKRYSSAQINSFYNELFERIAKGR